MASPTCVVLAVPPRSGVRGPAATAPAAISASVAGSMIVLSQELRLSVTVSIGVACLAPGDAEGDPAAVARAWVAHADTLLYVAKESGRNRCCLFNQVSDTGATS